MMLSKQHNFFYLLLSRVGFVCLLIPLNCLDSFSQCPANIDFEDGTFKGWTCWTGDVKMVNNQNVVTLNSTLRPVEDRHEIIFPGTATDLYGKFLKNCPNGSGSSIRLGNDKNQAEAEAVSYQFTIPAGQNEFSLIYYYAVVFQDPGHLIAEQPKLEIEIKNLTDNTTIGCSSFSFIATSGLPGFFKSSIQIGDAPIWCKDWSANSINLDGMAGKTIQLFFKTADCTQGGHFGYAYVDVNTECSGSIVGSTFCRDDTAVNVVAPYGYQNYTWYNTDFTRVLGTTQVLRLYPPPVPGSIFPVELIPYNGYGCKDTLFAHLFDTLIIKADAGPDKAFCNNVPVQIGGKPRQQHVYKWKPAAGLSDPNISNPFASPTVSTKYVLTVNHDGGGCIDTDTVEVKAGFINDSLQVLGDTSRCASVQNIVLQVNQTDSIQWFKNGIAIAGADQNRYPVSESGVYHAMLFTNSGCTKSTIKKAIQIYSTPKAAFAVNSATQCFPGHRFIFINSSSFTTGTIPYTWDLGDGTVLYSTDITHQYSKPGIYTVKLFATGILGCRDSSVILMTVHATPSAGFSVKPVCTNLNVPLLNTTINNTTSLINYSWDFGNGQHSTLRDPVYSYSLPGNYSIKLIVSTLQCPANLDTAEARIDIDAPLPAIRYATKDAVINYPLALQARVFGNSVLWTPAKNLDAPASYSPVFYGSSDQLYLVEIKTSSGCLTVDTQLVKAFKKIEIYVPSAFSPNDDGFNDYLRPYLMGFKNVRYFKIFNRAGQLVFQSITDRPGWNGKLNGYVQDSQVVVWMIEAEDVDGIIHRRKGTTLLLR